MEKFHAVEMDSVIPQLGFVIAKKDIKVLTVQVIKISTYINYLSQVTIFWYMDILEFTCPEDCSNAGNCGTSTGECSCFSGRHGIDCSSKYLFKTKTIQK